MNISFIIPGRNNLKYFKWAYASIRKNQGNHNVEICFADDASDDGTWDWIEENMKSDPDLIAIRNNTGTRWGHTILYDMLVDVSKNDICMIYHCDMYLTAGALDAIEKHIKPKTAVSLTRIEPPLHPDGPEKVLHDWGTEPEDFNEEEFNKWFDTEYTPRFKDKTTDGIFAPFAFYKKDFTDINGHDPLYAPQSKEDSDLFNRFQLNGMEFIQTWEGAVYHMTCRGSRFNPTLTTVGTNSDEWVIQNVRSHRNFIRKWGTMVHHTPLMNPIVPYKYSVGVYLSNPNYQVLQFLEPFFDHIHLGHAPHCEDLALLYIEGEQPNTDFLLHNKLVYDHRNLPDKTTITIDGNKFSNTDANYIYNLPFILQSITESAEYALGNMILNVTVEDEEDLKNRLNELIVVKPFVE